MVDLCVGPHIPHTGKIKAFMVTKVNMHEISVSFSNHLLYRILHHISSATLITTLYNVFTGSLSLTKNN
jgi:threonyl-tRNA synthetase